MIKALFLSVPILLCRNLIVTESYFMLLQSSESVKELYTLLKEKLEASKKSPPEPEEAPSLDLGLHPVTVPPTPSTPTTPI